MKHLRIELKLSLERLNFAASLAIGIARKGTAEQKLRKFLQLREKRRRQRREKERKRTNSYKEEDTKSI